MPSLARSVPKPFKVGQEGKVFVPRDSLTLRCRPPTQLVVKVKKVKSEVKRFLSFYLYETFICYRGCLDLNFYIGKKVQKNFLMGLKIW